MTAAPSYTADDYRTAFQALMPRGAAWPRDADAVQTRVITGLVQSAAQLDADADQLLVDAFPGSTTALLGEWEASVGLPDPVAGQAPTSAKRSRALLSRLAGPQGFSRASVTAFATSFGYVVQFGHVDLFRMGRGRIGDRLFDKRWAEVVFVTLAEATHPPDALTPWDRAFCVSGIGRMAPATVTLVFQP